MALLLSRLRCIRLTEGLMRQAQVQAQVHVRGKKRKAGKKAAVESDDGDSDAIDVDAVDSSMSKVIESLEKSLSRLRSSGASPDLLDDVRVEAYGTISSLKEVAQVSVRDGKTLSVSVFDPAVSAAVEKGIRGAGLNLNPVSDGNNRIRVPIARATKETREALKKNALKEAEKARIATRHVRRDALSELKRMKDEIATDQFKMLEKAVQQTTDKHVGHIDRLVDTKVKAIQSA